VHPETKHWLGLSFVPLSSVWGLSDTSRVIGNGSYFFGTVKLVACAEPKKVVQNA
jgi:hypothetical protein